MNRMVPTIMLGCFFFYCMSDERYPSPGTSFWNGWQSLVRPISEPRPLAHEIACCVHKARRTGKRVRIAIDK